MPQVYSVIKVEIQILKSNPPQYHIKAHGKVTTAGWSNPRLEPYMYIQFPPDGFQDFNFMADPPAPDSIVAQVISSITAEFTWSEPPSIAKGVRVHAAKSKPVVKLFSEKSIKCS